MIEFKLFFGLISYYFVMFATPGPNNAMLTASGIKFGFKRTLPHMFGIPFGHTIQISLVCFGLGTVFQKFPIIQFYLKWFCFAYLLYLGWQIIGSFANFVFSFFGVCLPFFIKSHYDNSGTKFFAYLSMLNKFFFTFFK